jgi:hypothetical protein
MIQVIDNFVSKFYKEDLHQAIYSSKCAWVHHNETSNGYSNNYSWVQDENTEETDLFAYKPDSNPKEEIISYQPLIYNIQELVNSRIYIERIKTNLMLPSVKKNPFSYNRPHIDHPLEYAKTLIYYVNDSDGDTVIFDKKYTGQDPGKLNIVQRITPKAGTAVLFDSNVYHAGSTPEVCRRSVINVIFWSMEEHLKKQVRDTPFDPLPEVFTSVEQLKKSFPGI